MVTRLARPAFFWNEDRALALERVRGAPPRQVSSLFGLWVREVRNCRRFSTILFCQVRSLVALDVWLRRKQTDGSIAYITSLP